jgi:hypothetical protein
VRGARLLVHGGVAAARRSRRRSRLRTRVGRWPIWPFSGESSINRHTYGFCTYIHMLHSSLSIFSSTLRHPWKKCSAILFFRHEDETCNIHTYIPLTLYPPRGSRGVSDITPRASFYQNYLAVRNTADVTVGKPIAVYLKCKCY